MNLSAWLELLEQRHPKTIDLGLDRCGAVYRRLGSPKPADKIFTVAGTNGKGSTVAYLAAMSTALGQRCGTYTSPHILRFNERITIMGEAVTDDCLVRAFAQVEAAREDVSLTYFEFTTLAALLILKQAELDCVVLEVGLGGRLDTVNLVDTDCAVITPIGLDHQDFLGPDLQSIATEKAGIMRPGTPVVLTEAHPPAVVLQIALDLKAPVCRRGDGFDLRRCNDNPDTVLEFTLGGQVMQVAPPAMAGKHQLDNLAAALAALSLLNPGCFANAAQISDAIRGCKVPGRLQKVCSQPEILLDVGHNELAAQAVAAFLREKGKTNTACVLAMLADKSAEEVARALGGVCSRWLCAGSPGVRGQSGSVLAGRVQSTLPGARVSAFGSLDDALQSAVADLAENQTILVFGSFSTASDAMGWLQNSMKRDRHDAARITSREPETDPRDKPNG